MAWRSTNGAGRNLISTQAITNDVAIGDVARTALEELEKGINGRRTSFSVRASLTNEPAARIGAYTRSELNFIVVKTDRP